ncbi:hypothetical protein [Actinomycetospora flava]|uniref:Uncharacterized protein n=1 Tax=Actinomycetospora flava TaxID=3129232 RepID=A0ABU8LZT0_9PSEU
MADGSPRRTRRTSTSDGDGAERSDTTPARRRGERPSGERRASGSTSGRQEAGGRPDVYLDVPKLEVEHLGLKVQDLRAKVSLQAEVLNLLKLNVGVDAQLGSVELEIDGVQAEATLKVRLDEVAGIIDRVLTTIDRNPQILETIARSAETAVREVGSGVGAAAGEVGRAAGDAVGEIGQQAGSAVGELGGSVGDSVGDAVGSVGGAVGDVGEAAADTAGEVAGTATETAGDVAGEATGEDGSDGDEAPKAARRRRSSQQSSGQSSGSEDDSDAASEEKPRRGATARPRPARRAKG